MNVLAIYSLLLFSLIGLKPNDAPCNFKTAVGQQVPDFQFTTIDGETMSVSDLKGKVILINLFGTRCPPCIKEMPHINKEIFKRHKRKNFVVLSIGATDTTEQLMAFKEKHGYDFTFVADPWQEIFELFSDCIIPRNLVIDKTGKILYQAVEFNKTPFNRMVKMIDKELAKS